MPRIVDGLLRCMFVTFIGTIVSCIGTNFVQPLIRSKYEISEKRSPWESNSASESIVLMEMCNFLPSPLAISCLEF